jgi:hypothetical protein
MNLFLSFLMLGSIFVNYTPTEQARFEIIFDDDKIGHVSVSEMKEGNHTVRDLKTISTARVIISIHVETEAKVTRNKNGVIIEGIGYRHANRGSEDVHAHTQWIGDKKYKVSRNGESWVLNDHPIHFCIADMYFIEPINKTQVYSNMYGANLKIAKMGDGKYHVITPDKKDSYYTYHNGKLMEVEVRTPVGKVFTRRV